MLMTEPDQKTIRGAIERAVRDEEPSARLARVDSEMAVYLSLEGTRRLQVAERLLAIDRLPPSGARRTVDVIAVASELGLMQSAVYRLLKLVERHGPVTGLLRGRSAERRASTVRDGFGSPLDDWIAEVLRRRPGASVAEVERHVRSRILMLDGGPRPPMPSPSAMRRRVNYLRAAGTPASDPGRPLGDVLSIDHCGLDVDIVGSEEEMGGLARPRASAVFLIDHQSGVVLGSTVFVEGDYASGLDAAIGDLEENVLPSLALKGIRTVVMPRSIRWTVPAELIPKAKEVVAGAEGVGDGPLLDAVAGVGARMGADVMRHLGDRIDCFGLLPGQVVEGDDGRLTTQYRSREIAKAGSFRTVQKANAALRSALAKRNDRILGGETEVIEGHARIVPMPVKNEGGFAASIDRLFAPVRVSTSASAASGGPATSSSGR